GFGASIGYFRALDGLKKFIPSVQLNLTVNRSYAHVRALQKVSDGLNIPAKDFVIPQLLHDLSVVIASPKKASVENGAMNQNAVAS
ncbi:hypothetical protein ABTF80_20925, partial [Acinetobacter baumannii]